MNNLVLTSYSGTAQSQVLFKLHSRETNVNDNSISSHERSFNSANINDDLLPITLTGGSGGSSSTH